MKVRGNIDLQNNLIEQMVIAVDDQLPTQTKVGRIAFNGGRLWICVKVDGSEPVWVPLTNERTAFVHEQIEASREWTVNHSLDNASPIIQIYAIDNTALIPDSIEIIDRNTVKITLGQAITGRVVVVSGSETTVNQQHVGAIPLAFVSFCPSRNMNWPGFGAADGQLLDRATFPDIVELIVAGKVPVVDDATWLADPTQRGKFSLGDGETTFRMPDYNGKQAGSLGAVFQRGDGVMGAGENGLIQRDALQTHTHDTLEPAASIYGPNDANATRYVSYATRPSSEPKSARLATETRPLNVTGCWVIKLFGAVVNVGSADAAQLASDYVNLASRVQLLEGEPSLGWDQRWIDVTTDRNLNVTYTNTTGRPIMLSVYWQNVSVGNDFVSIEVDGLTVAYVVGYGTTYLYNATTIIPNGSSYVVKPTTSTMPTMYWKELR